MRALAASIAALFPRHETSGASCFADPLTWRADTCVYCGHRSAGMLPWRFFGPDGEHVTTGACLNGCSVVAQALASVFTAGHPARLVTVGP